MSESYEDRQEHQRLQPTAMMSTESAETALRQMDRVPERRLREENGFRETTMTTYCSVVSWT